MPNLRINQQQHMPLPPLMPSQPLGAIHLDRIRHPKSPPIAQPVINGNHFSQTPPFLPLSLSHPPQHVTPIPIPRPNVHHPPALHKDSDNLQSLETRTNTAEMVIQHRQKSVRDFHPVSPRFRARPLEVLVRPGQDVEVGVRVGLFLRYRDSFGGLVV